MSDGTNLNKFSTIPTIGKYGRLFSLSDIQIAHPNLMKFEFESRIVKAGLVSDQVLSPDNITSLEKAHKDSLLVKSCEFLISKYFQFVKENLDNFDTFIDLGDFVFNISKGKIKFLETTGLAEKLREVFLFLRSNGKKTVLVLGNHDDSAYSDYYDSFFDEIVPFLLLDIDTSNVFHTNSAGVNVFNKVLITHYPYSNSPTTLEDTNIAPSSILNYYNEVLTAKIDHYDDFNWSDVDGTDLRAIVDAYGVFGYKILNLHGHTHSKCVEDDIDGNLVHLNRCLDYLILQ